MVGLGYCLLFFCSFVFLCVTSSVSLTGFYTEDEPHFGNILLRFYYLFNCYFCWLDTTTETNATWKTKEEFLGVLPGEALTGKDLQDELQRVKKQERNFIEELVKARRTEEGLRRNVIRLSLELRAVNNRIRSLSKEKRNTIQDDASFPSVFVVTPTFKRYVQKAELTRISQAFKPVKKLHWIVVEDSVKKTDLVANFLHNSGLKYTHLNVRTSSFLRRHKNEIRRLKPRGVEQRNLAIEWIRKNINPHRTPGVVYFADDDNTYDSRIFDQVCFYSVFFSRKQSVC